MYLGARNGLRNQGSYHQERLHLVLLFHRDLIYIFDTSEATGGDATMFFNRLKDGPSLIAVQRVAC